MGRRALVLLTAAVLAAVGLWVWQRSSSSPEREIARRLHELAGEFNASTTDGLGTLARAARLGQHFTPDVVVELGSGSPPIHGRDTLIGMAARLQPRTAAFLLELTDVTVEMVDDTRANLSLTAVIRRRNDSGEESLDAREFSGEMRLVDGQWRLSRITSVQTLRK
jgi:hypothetical protein